MAALDIHLCEVMPRKYTWVAMMISVYGGEAMGKLLPYLLGVIMFSNDNQGNMWHYFVAILSIPSVLLILLAIIFIDESPIYLWSKGKNDQAVKILIKFFSKDEFKEELDEVSTYKQLHCSQEKEETSTALENIKFVLRNGPVLRGLICVTLIGCSVKYTTFGLSYIATELVFLSGQTNSNYCSGTESKSYYLENSDYLVLSAFMISAFCVKVLAMSLAKIFDMGFQKSGSVCLGVSVCLAACLYACPDYWVALIIYGLIDASSAIVEVYYVIYVAQLISANIRSTIYGFMKFLMYVPLTTTPYMIQVLAKKSQHYLTTATVIFISISLLAVLLLPKKVQTGFK